MTKKDYQAIARAIHTAREDNAHTQDWHEATAGEVTRTVADALAADNPRFDRARFITACETGDMGKPKRIPLCAQAMGCLCANHARGASVSALCDARE